MRMDRVCRWLGLTMVIAMAGCGRESAREVVVYTALDRGFSEPVLQEFTRRTGIRVLPKYDTESTKTVGLVQTLIAEKDRPRCDVFWNNEIVNTIRLKNQGLLEKFVPAAAAGIPATFKDAEGFWCGFAARARVLIVNTNEVRAGSEPRSIRALADPIWKGRAGIGKPLFGTTASHISCLYASWGEKESEAFLQAMRSNQVQVLAGNKAVADAVAAGKLAWGLTDTDDAIVAIDSGAPVKIVYPDAEPDGVGVLFIPNTLSLVKNAPHADAGRQLIEFLLSPDVELMLARCPSAQIPLNPAVKETLRVETPATVKAMPVDFAAAAGMFEKAAQYIASQFME